MTVPYHLKDAKKRHTIISTNKNVTLFLTDSYQLRITPKRAKQPLILDAVTVLALANTLIDDYSFIVSEARKHNGVGTPGRKSDDAQVSGFCGL